MDREPPQHTPEEARELMLRWATDLEALEPLRRTLGPTATIEDALRFHRRLNQYRRQPSKVMREEVDP